LYYCWTFYDRTPPVTKETRKRTDKERRSLPSNENFLLMVFCYLEEFYDSINSGLFTVVRDAINPLSWKWFVGVKRSPKRDKVSVTI
jgi:hypothetical protein